MRLLLATLLLASARAGAEPVAMITTTTTTTIVTTTTSVTVDDAPAIDLAPPALTAVRETPATRSPTFRFTAAIGPALGIDTKDKCGGGECGGVHVDVGGAIADRVLVLVGASLMAPVDGRVVHHVEVIAVQYWPTDRLWGEIGLGAGNKRSWIYELPPDRDLSGLAPAGTIALGFEAVVRGSYSIGFQARLASTADVDHTSFAQLLVGLSLY